MAMIQKNTASGFSQKLVRNASCMFGTVTANAPPENAGVRLAIVPDGATTIEGPLFVT